MPSGCAWSYVPCHAIGVCRDIWGHMSRHWGVRGHMGTRASVHGHIGIYVTPLGCARTYGDTCHAVGCTSVHRDACVTMGGCTLAGGHVPCHRCVRAPLVTHAAPPGCVLPLGDTCQSVEMCPLAVSHQGGGHATSERRQGRGRTSVSPPQPGHLQNRAGLHHGDVPKHPARTRLPGRVPGSCQPFGGFNPGQGVMPPV